MATIGEAESGGSSGPARAEKADSALPRLAGWKFALFCILWFFALALTVSATIAGIHYQNVRYEAVERPLADLGLPTSLPAPVLGPPIGSQARAAGIVAGLRLIAIDGRALAPNPTWSKIAASLDRPEGTQVRIRTRSPGGLSATMC